MQIDPDKLPRAVALEHDLGEIVYSAGALPQLLPYSFNGAGLRLFGKLPGFLNDPAFERANARAVTNAGPKARNSGDLRWHVHVALWAASHAARLEGDLWSAAWIPGCSRQQSANGLTSAAKIGISGYSIRSRASQMSR